MGYLRSMLVFAVAALAGLTSARLCAAQAALPLVTCGSTHQWIPNAVDYRLPSSRRNINDMNHNHFNSDVRNLVKGQTSYRVVDDLVFMLQAAPNHAEALQVLSRYMLNDGKEYEHAPLECFFVQAIKFVPDDPTVRQIYGLHLYKAGRRDEGLEQLSDALQLAPDSAEIHYNIGLLYAETKDLKKALEHAQRAYALGYPLPGLRRKLEKLGAWRDPPPPTASDDPAP